MLLLGMGVCIFLQFPPDKFSFYPKCQLHQLTGLHCPGCGATRCLLALLHGEFAEAARKNILAFVAIPTIGIYATILSFNWLFARPVRQTWNIKPWLGVSLVILLIAFGILRNLPWPPFIILAPH